MFEVSASSASDDASGYSAEAIEAVRRHPAFEAAMRASARGFVEHYFGNRLVNLLASDRGRTFAAGMALHLHYAGGGRGFTAADLKALCVREQICSAGRAAALIALMQWGGHLVAETVDGKVRRLVPTERLLALHRDRWRIQLSSGALVLPEMVEALGRLSDPAFMKAYGLAQSAQFLAGWRAAAYAPEIVPFAERNAGAVVLFSLLLADLDQNAPPPSATGLAKRFHVSRMHVTRLLRETADLGLLLSADPAAARPLLSPELRAGAERLFAVLFLFNASAARAALEAAAGRAHGQPA